LNLEPGATFGESMVLAQYLRAIGGDTMAAKLIVTFIDGFPTRRVEAFTLTAEVDGNIYRDKLRALLREDGRLLSDVTHSQETAE
jgi:hypothetical protein